MLRLDGVYWVSYTLEVWPLGSFAVGHLRRWRLGDSASCPSSRFGSRLCTVSSGCSSTDEAYH